MEHPVDAFLLMTQHADWIPQLTSRVVIDLKIGESAKVYFETFGDEDQLSVILTDLGVQIKRGSNPVED